MTSVLEFISVTIWLFGWRVIKSVLAVVVAVFHHPYHRLLFRYTHTHYAYHIRKIVILFKWTQTRLTKLIRCISKHITFRQTDEVRGRAVGWSGVWSDEQAILHLSILAQHRHFLALYLSLFFRLFHCGLPLSPLLDASAAATTSLCI